jgi:hypothetical protein
MFFSHPNLLYYYVGVMLGFLTWTRSLWIKTRWIEVIRTFADMQIPKASTSAAQLSTQNFVIMYGYTRKNIYIICNLLVQMLHSNSKDVAGRHKCRCGRCGLPYDTVPTQFHGRYSSGKFYYSSDRGYIYFSVFCFINLRHGQISFG